MFPNLAVVFLSLTMAVAPAYSSVPGNTQVHVDKIEKMEEFVPLEKPNLPSAEVSMDQLKKAPEPVSAPIDLDSMFKKYAEEYGVDSNLLKRIAKCESGFNPKSDSGYYGGMFQYATSTWTSTRSAMGLDPNPELRFNAEESIRTSAFKISRGGASAWPVCSKI